MTFEEIEKYKDRLSKAQELNDLSDLARELKLTHFIWNDGKGPEHGKGVTFNIIHTHLQTEYMAATCKECMESGKTAKWACAWAAVAAVSAFITVFVSVLAR